jgi:hypothetical protein
MDLKDVLDNLNRSTSASYDRNVEKLLDRLGLERKQNTTRDVVLPALGIFGAGLAAGATLGLLFAPKRGEELRSDIQHRLEDLRQKSAAEYDELRRKSEEALRAAREKAADRESAQSREGSEAHSAAEG